MITELDKLIATAQTLAGAEHPCRILGHRWIFVGGKNCGCEGGNCSVPVHKCEGCDDYDYGDNDEAKAIKAECEVKLNE